MSTFPSATETESGARRRTAIQFLRFVAVGISAVAVDAGIHYLLMFVLHLHGRPLSDVVGESLARKFTKLGIVAQPHTVAFAFFKVISTFCGIVDSFYLNRLWTFEKASEGSSKRQFQRYAAVVGVGLLLNTAIASGLNAALPFAPKVRWAIATLVATVIVSVWNFNGHKRWSFAPGLVDVETDERGRATVFRWAVLAFLALGVGAALLSLRFPIQHDGPVVMYPAWLVWTGQRHLYRDLFDFNLPGSYGIYGVMWLLTGFRDLPVQILHLALLGLLGWLTLRLAGPRYRLAGVLAFAVYLEILFADTFMLSLQREFFIVLLAAGAVAVALDSRQPARAALAVGAMGGYASLVKPHAAVAFLIVLGFLLAWEEKGRRARTAGTFVMGGLVPVVLGLGIVAASGGLGELRSIVKEYVPLYGAMTGIHEVLPAGERTGYLLSNLLGTQYTKIAFLLAVLGPFLIRRERREDARLAKLSSVLAALSAYFLIYPEFSGQFWSYHYLPFDFFSALSIAVTMHVLVRRATKAVPAYGYLTVAFLTLWSVGLGTVKQLRHPTADKPNPSALMIRDYLERNLRPGETVQPLDWTVGCVEGMLRARVPLATRFIYDFTFYHHVSTPTVQGLRRRFIEEFDASRPAVVLQAYGPAKDWPKGVDTTRSFPELEERLARDYRIVEQDGEIRILVRRDRTP